MSTTPQEPGSDPDMVPGEDPVEPTPPTPDEDPTGDGNHNPDGPPA